ncbi:MAG: CDP-glycerol glycerophosphotransferase family protein [Chloroflexota bacterium]|nr:CDP-glycerol glycerophosphotransferase family protein [Chloroflexota bacterium]
MKRLVVVIRTWLVRIGFELGRRLPVRRRVLLASSHADRLGGNLAFIHAELRRRHPEVRVAVLAHRTVEGWRGRLNGALWALTAGYHLARARLVVLDDYFFPLYVVKPRRGTTVVQTWHASGAFKKFGHSVLDRTFGADEALTSRVQIHANYDICLIGSQTATPHYAEAFGQPPERFVSRLGIPRTDLFSDADATARASAQIRQRYGLPANRRVILYAPTFRGERVTRARHTEQLDLGELRRELGDGFALLVRQHPFVRSASPIGAQLAGFAFDVSDHHDINELMLVSDVLITDYSSAIFECSLLERPMAFFAPDLDSYERERGFYFDYGSGVPGPVFTETRELARWLRDGPVDLDRVRRFRDASFEVADGRASQRFVESIVLPALSG